MKDSKPTTERKRAKKGQGRLYIRNGEGMEFPAGTPNVKNGYYHLEFQVPTGEVLPNGKPKKKKRRTRLLDDHDRPITSLKAAEQARDKLLRQYIAQDKVELLSKVKRDLAVVKDELEEAKREHAEAVEEANPPLTIADAWDAYEISHEAPETGADTIKYYASYWKKFREWLSTDHPGTLYIRDITSDMAKQYAAALRESKKSANTYNKTTGFLSLFFRVLKEDEDANARLKENPFERIKKRTLQTQSRRELTIAELKNILTSATGDLQTLLAIGTFTGLRLGDCCTLRWSEVDLDRGIIKRIPNKTARKNKPVLIGIPAALYDVLSMTKPDKRKGYVLPRYADLYTYRNDQGRPTKQPDISNEIQAHFIKCGIQVHRTGTGFKLEPCKHSPTGYKKVHTGVRAVIEVGFHSLRHTYVSLHAERGTPQALIQGNVGHANPAMTAHYLHVSEETAVKTAQVLSLDEPTQSRTPPDWVAEKLEAMTTDNWQAIRDEILGK